MQDQTLDEQIADVQRKMQIKADIMRYCYSDAAYRIHQNDFDSLVKELIALEKKKQLINTGLNLLAMQFRSNKDEAHRKQIAAQYREVVLAFIDSKQWNEMPSLEDMLPDEYMPQEFKDYWS